MTSSSTLQIVQRDQVSGKTSFLRAVWLRQRASLLVLVGITLVGAGAIVLARTNIHINIAWYVANCSHPPFQAECPNIFNAFSSQTTVLTVLVMAIHVFPLLMGVFIGAPLVAREFESGTFKFTWTQGAGRTRYVMGTLAVLCAAVTVVAVGLGLLLAWYAHAFEVVGLQSRWESGTFDTTPLALVGWTLFSLLLGALVGAWLKRVVVAMGVTAAVAGGCLIAAFGSLNNQLFQVGTAAVRTAEFPSPRLVAFYNIPTQPGQGFTNGTLIVRSWITTVSGHAISPLRASNLEYHFERIKVFSYAAQKQWLSSHGISHWLSYQSPNRFWIFQTVVTVTLVALSIALGFGTRVLIRRG
jgi:ABC-type transport system involved in multi-copper enzyme maturation permease subunit